MARPQYELLVNPCSPPPGAVQLARQEGLLPGKMWTAVAHTQWGDIPGKAAGGTCWYPYNSVEHKTQDFSWLVSPKSELILLLNEDEGPPITAVKVGHQSDDGVELFAAVAVTDDWGSIPGKAKGNTCWFSYDGSEHETKVFYWVATRFKLERKGSEVPSGAVLQAWLDSGEALYSAVAHTAWGDIPGRANHDTCWYSYGGEEHIAEIFSYVVAPPDGAGVIKNSSGPPASALRTGYQSDVGEDLYAAVAITEKWGTIPGKAKGNQCWYSYDGKEHIALDFYWVISSYDSLTQDKGGD